MDNKEGRATGWLPGQLSAQGRTQAQQLGSRRISDRITAVFGSDLAQAANPGHRARRHLVGPGPLHRRHPAGNVVDQDFAWQEGWEYRVN